MELYLQYSIILKQQQPLFAALIEIHKSDLMPSDAEITAMVAFICHEAHSLYYRSDVWGEMGNRLWGSATDVHAYR